MSGFAMGLLGGLAGGAENIVNRNNLMDADERATNRQKEILTAQEDIIKAREQRALEMKQSEENRAGQLFRSAVEKNSPVLSDDKQSEQYRQLKEQGGEEMMPGEIQAKRGKVDTTGLLSSAMETGNKQVVDMAQDRFKSEREARKDDALIDVYESQSAMHKAHANQYNAKAAGGGNSLAQDRFNRTLSADERKAMDSSIDKAWGFYANDKQLVGVDDKQPPISKEVSLKFKGLYAKGFTEPETLATMAGWKESTATKDGVTYAVVINPKTNVPVAYGVIGEADNKKAEAPIKDAPKGKPPTGDSKPKEPPAPVDNSDDAEYAIAKQNEIKKARDNASGKNQGGILNQLKRTPDPEIAANTYRANIDAALFGDKAALREIQNMIPYLPKELVIDARKKGLI